MNRTASSFIIAIVLLSSLAVQAQQPGLRLVPLASTPVTTQARIQQTEALDTVLLLPFWDDFSQPITTDFGVPIPDTLKWMPSSQNTRINAGLPINPPTIGVASFDGVQLDGTPYRSGEEDDASDSLVSRPINLAAVPDGVRNSVYFSFYWQQRGNGEFPDPGDSLRLQFLTNENIWRTVWSQDGGDSLATREFAQEIFPVNDAAYFHERFQLRFQAFSRLTGAFDTWNIDYVYLNQNRSEANTAYLDRAITKPPSSLFGEYTAIPMQQFRANPGQYIGTSSVEFFNLNVELQPIRYSATVRDTVSDIQLVLNDSTAISPVPIGLERDAIFANPLDVSQLDLSIDSLYLETEFSIAAGDTVFNETIDYRVNDTARAVFVLDDWFAYDDGEAEFGVEINQQGGKVAYQFVAPEEGLLTHIDVHFPNLSQNQRTPIQLLVWRSLTDSSEQEVLLRSVNTLSIPDSAYNGFTSYELVVNDIPFYVTVQDTFYIGYEQQSDQFVAVGFDKNTNTGDKLFFNVNGNWVQNRELEGSLMMHPRFDRASANFILSAPPPASEESITSPLKIYPNPTDGVVWIEGQVDQAMVMNLYGQRLQEYVNLAGKASLDLSGLPPGLYIIKINKKGVISSHKILLR
ncbi:T9SS type A sorting domain-containing protein [Tunicatimonas pelagia]|uniref:T9SS type A sorting domain-containing protein n=1 Tax=Tunicatimonas pelagia TaxID=931531 RepID=UPI002666EC4C|nr:T9SS type A sorting domain-containing protein [Tunicatimonas pelagia]WKN42006.1 T9SS type A sorting domain-containing protein [Tunicatimonas pelagia]